VREDTHDGYCEEQFKQVIICTKCRKPVRLKGLRDDPEHDVICATCYWKHKEQSNETQICEAPSCPELADGSGQYCKRHFRSTEICVNCGRDVPQARLSYGDSDRTLCGICYYVFNLQQPDYENEQEKRQAKERRKEEARKGKGEWRKKIKERVAAMGPKPDPKDFMTGG
jgi:hypothetical protein